MLRLNRNTCENNNWCDLLQLNLNHEHFNNMEWVYIIWHWWENPHTVRIWQGYVKERLSEHRTNNEITKYQKLWLYVTWASVSPQHRDWIEKYLWDTLTPLVWERFPDRTPIITNLPR